MTEIKLPEPTVKTLSKKSTITLVAGKARVLSGQDPDFVRADIGELCAPGLFPPGYKESLEETAATVMTEGRIGYTVPDGDNALKKLIFKHSIPDELQALILEKFEDEAKKQGVDFEKYKEDNMQKHVAVTHGGTGALGAAVSVFLTDQKNLILVNQRTWQNHNLIVDMHGGMIWPVPLIDEQGRVADPDSILKLCHPVKDRIAGFLYTLINNPDGAVITDPAEQAKLERIIKELGVPLILDVAYHRMVFNGKEAQPFSPDVLRQTVVCGTYSKTLQIPGERLGYISCLDPRVARFVYFYNRSHSGCPSVSPQRGLIAHLKKYETAPDEITDYNKKLLKEIEARRNILVEKVKEKLGWEMKHPGGAIYAIIPLPADLIKEFGDVDKFTLDLVDRGGVSAISGTVFEFRVRSTNNGYEVYTPLPTSPEVAYLRFCYGFTPLDRVELAVDHIKNFLVAR
ncbi:MAG: aminotransferase class I/II-fold pyridoxal phosphate-dependent enzyme [Candidatus Aminicenantes bacterium]|nr:aminotransferase class I/II-fold pyridoxal phosphate-dependent enzyme [Candidatus Aminicenantes bacterium]